MKLLLCIATALLFVTGPVAAEIYKWTDENGRVHYGDRNVKGSRQIEVRTTPSQQARDAAEGDEVSESAAADPARCEAERTKLKSFESASRIMQKTTDGGEAPLSDDDRAALIAQQKGVVDHYCGSGS